MRTTAHILISLGLMSTLGACNDAGFKSTTPKLNPTVSRNYTQDAYPAEEAKFTQGYLGAPQTDKFDQGEWGALDLLVVVDTSSSMAEEQANLATKLEPLLSKVDRSDWQIAVVTTDRAAGCQRALIKKSDPNAKAKFEQAILAGTRGDGVERGIGQAVEGLKCAQSPWVRPGSTVAVLIVSDEDNCHTGNGDDDQYGCAGEPGRFAAHLTQYLSSIRTIGKDARVYGLFWDPGQEQNQCSTALNRGHEYAKVVQDTKGTFGSICDADYSPTLQRISTDIGQILKYEFELTQSPDGGTLQILVDGKAWSKFEVDGKKIKFTEAPPFGSKVEVGYRIGKEGELAKQWKLPKAAAPGSLKVTIDGEELDADAFTYDAASQAVVFDEAPHEKAEIEVAYKALVPLKKTFDIGPHADPASIDVKVDGKSVRGFAYDPKTGAVTLKDEPAETSQIVVSFKNDQTEAAPKAG